MTKWLTCIFVALLSLLIFNNEVYSQFSFLEDVHDQLEVDFLRKKIEVSTNESFFNVLKVKNPSDREVTFQTNFSYPASWSFIGDKNQRVTLSPNDSILIPFRAAVSKKAKGEIGYTIVASLTDLNGKTFKNEYSFVNIPKIQKIFFSPVNRVEYLDQTTKEVEIGLRIGNSGNTDEIFYLEFMLDKTIETPGSIQGYYRKEVLLNSYSDTIIKLPVNLVPKANYYNKKFHRVSIKSTTVDTVLNSSIWVKELEDNIINEIPSKYKMLSLELSAQNLFSDYSPTYSGGISGNILFKKTGSIYYSMRTYGSNFYTDPWKYGRYLTEYNAKHFTVTAGDVSSNMEQSMFGRGILAEVNLGKSKIRAIGTTSVFFEKHNMGLAYQSLFPFGSIELGGSYVQNKHEYFDSKVAFLNSKLKFRKIGNISTKFSASIADYYSTEEGNQYLGFGGELGYYKLFFKNTTLNINTQYGGRTFSGQFNGRIETSGNISHILSNTKSINILYYGSRNAPAKFFNDRITPEIFSFYDETRVNYNNIVSKRLSYTFGLISESKEANNFIGYTDNFKFKTRNALLYSSLRTKDISGQLSFNIVLKTGMTFVSKYPNEKFDKTTVNKNWETFVITSSLRSRKWGIYASYNHRPHTINQQFSYFSANYFSKSVRLLPYLELFLIPKHLKLVTRGNYTFDITSETNRLNLANDLVGYLPYNLELTFTNTIGYQSNYDKVTETKFKYSSTYFEFRLKKDFVIDQPKYQYHNLDIVFFKDFNGNGVKEKDEPGIKDVLFSIQKDEEKVLEEEFNTSGYFMPTELLSNFQGEIKYKNIPNGFYTIKYNPISAIEGAYTSEKSTDYIHIGSNTKMYIPFVENNKIFGKVILNRSKLSNLGSIDISNIKVTAEDSQGKKISSLTDETGSFILYVPNVDKYKVRVNNIFFENFELEQNDFEVQLNGYRQFEINYVFNEKKRKINFTASYDYGSRLDGPGVEIVRRTNLSGTIKDATTLKPIVAEIKVVNKEGHEITSAKSSLKTGIFSLSFVAGDDYSVEVTSDDYWFHAEKLYSQQIVTFKNLKKDILLKGITVGSIIPMKTLNFEAGSYDIPATSFPELERLLKVLKKNPAVKIAIHGHADDLEIQDSETDLALERAKLVAKYLIANGYNRVKYVGHANTKPIADNDTEDGRKLNRRVEIVVTGK
ncbi:MAG: OmpA family protein [Salinivirgaceae bacterium]|nr:OmpA family protein [Salinivirgaceae bacterium]